MKAYYNQEKIASSLRNFFKKFSISKPLLKNLCLDLGLTIFNLCYYNEINFTLKFNFVLYDV